MKGNWKHGMSDTAIYRRWYSMVGRCKYPSHTSWKWYGALGVKVCERWLSFENFLLDMGLPPTADHSIERRNNKGDYCPDNCFWATELEQQNNRRNNLHLTHNGKTQSAAKWAAETGLSHDCILDRSRRGWSEERTLTQPMRRR